MFKIISLIIFGLCLYANSQITSDCGKSFGCFKDPANCVDDQCDHLIKWRNSTNGITTDFELTARVTPPIDVNSAWLGLAFAPVQEMGNDSAVLCFTNSSVPIQSYYLIGHTVPILLFPSSPALGITNSQVIKNGNFVTCRFTRARSFKDIPYFGDLNANQYFILTAYGAIDDQGYIHKHNYTATYSNATINFLSTNIYNTTLHTI